MATGCGYDAQSHSHHAEQAIANQQKPSAIEQAAAARDEVTAEQKANVTRVPRVGSAAIEAARWQTESGIPGYYAAQAELAANIHQIAPWKERKGELR